MKVPSFTRRIWESFGSTVDKRADYLWKLYLRAGTMRRNGNYLDIGCGSGQNAIVFGQDCQSIHCLDIESEGLKKCQTTFRLKAINGAFFCQGDAQVLPFKDAIFDSVSTFSVIEHVPEQHLAIREVSRVLKPGGELILQVPNKYFFIDLHTGIPLLHCFPSSIRRWLLRKLGYKGLSDVMNTQVPSRSELTSLIRDEFAKVHVLKIVYPSELIIPRLKPIYSALNLLGLFNLVPFGFLFIACKADGSRSLDKEIR